MVEPVRLVREGIQALCPQPVDFSDAPWRLRNRPYELLGDDRLVAKRIVDGVETVVVVDLASGAVKTLTEDSLAQESIAVAGQRVVAVLGSPDRPTRLASRSSSTAAGIPSEPRASCRWTPSGSRFPRR